MRTKKSRVQKVILALATCGLFFAGAVPAFGAVVYQYGGNLFTNTETNFGYKYTGTAQITGTTWYGTLRTSSGQFTYMRGTALLMRQYTSTACSKTDSTKRTTSGSVAESLNPFAAQTKYYFNYATVPLNLVAC